MRPKDFLLFLLPLVLFFVLGSHALHLPGLHYNEAYVVAQTIDILHPQVQRLGTYHLKLFGRPLPIGSTPYAGTLTAYFFIPPLLLFGSGVFVVRMTTLITTLLIGGVTFLFVKKSFSKKAALITTFLLMTDPSFVFFTRSEAGPLCFAILFQICALYSFSGWWRTGKKIYFAIGIGSLSLGLYDRISFGVFFVSSGLVVLALFGRDLRHKLGRFEVAFGIPFVVIGLCFVIRHVLRALAMRMETSTLSDRLRILFQTLSGIAVGQDWFPDKALGAGSLFFFLCLACILVHLLRLGRWSRESGRGRADRSVFLIFLFMLGFLLSMRSVRASRHFLYLYPLPHLLCALVLSGDLLSSDRRRIAIACQKVGVAVLTLLFFATMATNGYVLWSLHRFLEATGGEGYWSDAIYRLNDFLRQQKGKTAVCMAWGFHRNLIVLSGGTYRLQEPIWALQGTDPEGRRSLYESLFSGTENLYLLYSSQAQTFEELASSFRYQPVLVQAFTQRDGRPIYSVYALRKSERVRDRSRGYAIIERDD